VPSKSSGKTILKVKVSKKKVTITFIDRSKLECVPEVLASFYIYEGKELNYKTINEIKKFNASASLLKYAMSLLKKGHYSEWKMREKLYNKEGKKSDIDNIIKILKNNDLINDKMLILDTIEYANERNIGKNKITAILVNKGIFLENIPHNSFPNSIEKKKALNNLNKLEKKYDKYSYEQKKLHIYNALLSLGFDNDIARDTLSHIKEPKYKDEVIKLEKDLDKVVIRYKRSYEGFELKNKVISSLRTKGYKLNNILRKWDEKYGQNDF